MKVNEIFDSRKEIHWQTNGNFELGVFEHNGFEYLIQIEKRSLPFDELLPNRTAEISFSRLDIEDSDQAHSTTNDENYPFSVYGIIANALSIKFTDFDAFYFVTKRRHSDNDRQFQIKNNIYRMLVDKILLQHRTFFYEGNDVANNQTYLISRIKIHNMIDKIEEARNWIKSQKEN